MIARIRVNSRSRGEAFTGFPDGDDRCAGVRSSCGSHAAWHRADWPPVQVWRRGRPGASGSPFGSACASVSTPSDVTCSPRLRDRTGSGVAGAGMTFVYTSQLHLPPMDTYWWDLAGAVTSWRDDSQCPMATAETLSCCARALLVSLSVQLACMKKACWIANPPGCGRRSASRQAAEKDVLPLVIVRFIVYSIY